jgi:glycosyltransferase involved in cell wall biosynthesis
MSESEYLVSAIVSVYNCERFIKGCFEDLEDQTIANRLEIIVINSGSQENEDHIIKSFQERYTNIVYIKTTERETIYRAWNRAIKISAGKYLTNANADDRHRKDAFEIMVNVLESNHDVDLVYANSIVTNNENESFDRNVPSNYINRIEPEPNATIALLLKGSFIGPQPMWRKSIHKNIGMFNETLDVAGDYEFWLRMSYRYKFYHINEYLGLYLNHPNSAEHRNPELSFTEWYQVVNNYLKNAKERNHLSKKDLSTVKVKFSTYTLFQGHAFFIQGKHDVAKRALFKSIGFNPLNVKSYLLLLACYLPYRLFIMLKSVRNTYKYICHSKKIK